jgi:pyridoxamine 5'-phosphate oxidase
LEDPILQFQNWLKQATKAGISEPTAMTLATTSADGQPSARIVLLKEVSQDGFVFYTNYGSRKGRELAVNPRAALVFYWPQLERQVRITGTVVKTSRSQSKAYFQTRPRGSQLAAWASSQSSPIPDRALLEARVRKLKAKYAGASVPLPPNWGGYRLRPESIEFWLGKPNRLHDRLRYSREPGGGWKIERLAP